MSSTWKIYWWAKIDGNRKKKFGSDTITIEDDTLTEGEADDIVDENANGVLNRRDIPYLVNFSKYYVNATFCENYGVVKIKQLKGKEAKAA